MASSEDLRIVPRGDEARTGMRGAAGGMAAELAADHERVAHRPHALLEIAEDQKNKVTVDPAVKRSDFHGKAALMLRAIAAG